MPQTLKIDFVSDVSCPWCAVGLSALEQALVRLQGKVQAVLRFHPFELNPHMPAGGQDIGEHLTQKYGSTPEQQAQMRQTIAQRGADAGFEFNPDGRGRIYNTFDAHRLLHWAGLASPKHQLELKKALLVACHCDRQTMDTHTVLIQAAAVSGLDHAQAQEILNTDTYAPEVREAQAFYLKLGIQSVPAVIVNDQHLISGGQPADTFEAALLRISQQTASQ